MKGDGTTKLFGNAGRYYLPLTNKLADYFGGGTTDEHTYYVLNGWTTHQHPVAGTYLLPILGQQIGPINDDGNVPAPDDLRIEDYAVAYLREPTVLSFAKAAHPSRVHRPAYPDYVSIREIDADGKVIKEHRFMGLYTSSVYGESVRVIPYIRRKVAEIERHIIELQAMREQLLQLAESCPGDDGADCPIIDNLAGCCHRKASA